MPAAFSSSSLSSSSSSAQASAPREVLVVEDSATIRHMLVSAVGRIDDVRVTEAADGIDALRKLASQRFDLIMTDINMPVMDGLKLIKRVRDDARHQNVPIAVISTESADADRERAMALGANAYLIKPVQAEQVIACITQLLTGAGATDGG